MITPAVATLLAGGAAASWGSSDFLGGIASRRMPSTSVVVWMEITGLMVIPALFLIVPSHPTPLGLLLSTLAGGFGGLGLLMFYRAMQLGSLGVAATVTALGAAGIPVLAGLLGGERPRLLQLAGIVIGLVAIAVIGGEARTPASRRSLQLCLIAGVAFGAFLITSHGTGAGGAWTALTARLGSGGVMAIAATLSGTPPLLATVRGSWRLIWLCGVLDSVGVGAYVLASQGGLLALTALTASLYPVGTALLARAVLNERLRRPQAFGAGLAMLALLLISFP